MSKIKEIIVENSDVWKTESAFMSYIRGGIRRGLWNKHPLKLKLINSKRIQIPNPNPKGKKPTVWGGCCEICNNLFPSSEMQVDHKREKGSSLKEISDIQQFVEDMVVITQNDLRWVCKGCHDVISHSQKKGITFEQAKVEKQALEIIKQKQDKQWLLDRGITPDSTQAKRREQIVETLLDDDL